MIYSCVCVFVCVVYLNRVCICVLYPLYGISTYKTYMGRATNRQKTTFDDVIYASFVAHTQIPIALFDIGINCQAIDRCRSDSVLLGRQIRRNCFILYFVFLYIYCDLPRVAFFGLFGMMVNFECY